MKKYLLVVFLIISNLNAMVFCVKNTEVGTVTEVETVLYQSVRKVGKLVVVNVVVDHDGDGTHLFTLPAGFRPTVAFNTPFYRFQSSSPTDVFGEVNVYADGRVVLTESRISSHYVINFAFNQ